MDDDVKAVRIDVTADKPGRWVGVEMERPDMRDPERPDQRPDRLPWRVSLSIEQGQRGRGPDPWTWLASNEARALARALTDMADAADAENVKDPRDA